MRRGGRLFLLLGIVVAAVLALGLFFILQTPTPPPTDGGLVPTVELKKRIVVALINIPNNTVLSDTETFLELREIPETEFNAAAGQFFESMTDLQTKVTVRAITNGEPIRKADVVEAGLSLQIPPAQADQPRVKAFPFQVNNLSGVADQVKPNDFVDILASFLVRRTFLRPGFNENNEIIIIEEEFEGQTTKTLLQNVQVLQIRRPAPPEGTPTPGGPPPAQQGPPPTDASGQPAQAGPTPAAGGDTGTFRPGDWLLVVAVTDPQAEILKFSIETGTGITLVLRGRGDTAVENTIGATLDLLVSRFGLPLPVPAAPAVGGESQLTPLPTTATTPLPTLTPTPTPTP